jgi:O-antigen/teichoic acid export membrane protein
VGSLPNLLPILTRLNNRTLAVFVNLGVLSITTNLIVFVVSATLDVKESSLWFMCLSASAFLFVADMGISYALSRYLARYRDDAGSSDIGSAGRLILRFFFRKALVPFGLLSIALGGYLVIARARWTGTLHDSVAIVCLWVMISAYMLLSVLSKYLQLANEGLGRLANERYITSFCQTLTFLLAAAAIVATRNIWLLPMAYLLGFTGQTVWLYRSTGPGRSHPSAVVIDEAALDSLKHESRNLWLLNVLTLISQNVQVMSLAFFADPTAIAAFFFMQRLAGGASNLVGIMAIIDRSRITYYLAQHEYDSVIAMLRRNFGLVLLATLFCVAALVAFILLCNIYGLLHFRVSGVLLLLFAIDMTFAGMLGALGQYILATGSNPFLPWVAACSVLTVGLQFALVPRFGAEGAITAFMLSQMVTVYVASVRHMILTVKRVTQARRSGRRVSFENSDWHPVRDSQTPDVSGGAIGHRGAATSGFRG